MVGAEDKVQGLSEDQVLAVLGEALAEVRVDSRRLLILIPDGTRHAPIPMLYRLLNELLGRRTARLDFMIALGTHPPMPPSEIDVLVGMSASERIAHYPNSAIYNHTWDRPSTLTRIGVLPAQQVEELTEGLLSQEIPVDLNRAILDYDQLLICGPVFPHEVAGFSGGAKYVVPA